MGIAASSETSPLNSKLTAKQEVPKPTGVPAGAKGTFKGTLVENGTSRKVTWRLTFSGLSGPAVAAHIHLAAKGKPGPVAVPLCGPCKSGAHGTAKVTAKIAKAIESGKAYVNVHTQKNPGGEIRGQIAYS